MSDSGYSYYIEHIECILLFGLVGFLLNWFAVQKKFYILPKSTSTPQLYFLHVLFGFSIYISSSLFLSHFFAKILHSVSLNHSSLLVWSQLLAAICSLFFLLILNFSIQKTTRQALWKEPSGSTILTDCTLGVLTWFLGFPVVTVVEQFADTIIYALFKIDSFEQAAVHYLKMTLETPSLLVAALVTILILAPVMEEFLFRGLLQTWLKKHLGTKAAILIASLLFALFHISSFHGVGNLSLIPSLLTFSCFLGFIYERQKSLFASISLHFTFNLITTLRILFYPNS